MKGFQNARRLLWTLLITASFGAFTPAAQAQSARLTDDAYTQAIGGKGKSPSGTNFGASQSLLIDAGSGARAWLKFDVPDTLPAGVPITQARLRLWTSSVATAGNLDVRLVTSSWTEGVITDASAPGPGSLVVATPIPVGAAQQFMDIDITSAAEAWRSGAAINNGLALVPSTGSAVNAAFDSKESTSTSHAPELLLILGDVTSVSAGSGLSGGGAAGDVTLGLLSCVNGKILKSNGVTWVCADDNTSAGGSGTVTSITAGAGLTAGATNPITTNGTISVANGSITTGMLAFDPATQVELDAEATARVAGSATLQTNINNEAAARATADTAESTARASGDAALLPKAGGTMSGKLTMGAAGGNDAARDSIPIELVALSLQSANPVAISQNFQWRAQPVGSDTDTPSGKVSLLYGSGANAPAATGISLSPANNGTVTAGKFIGDGSLLTNLPSGGATTIEDGAVTAAKLADSSVTSPKIADGAIVDADINAAAAIAPTKILGTAATLGANSFTATQTITSGNLALPATSGATNGVITLGGVPFLHNFGGFNTFLGQSAGNLTMTGGGNTATGTGALVSNTTGNFNTAAGDFSLNENTTGGVNTAMGHRALFYNTTGSVNTATGGDALYHNIGGDKNTASGYRALFSNTTASGNTATGYNALLSNQTASGNTAAGSEALFSNTVGEGNTAIGYQGLYSNTDGINNTASGYQGLYSNTSGWDNTASGDRALYLNTTGSKNTATGNAALYFNTTASDNTATGWSALFSNTTGEGNTGTGSQALSYNSTGGGNTATGYKSLAVNQTGSNNTATGFQSLVLNTTGEYNTASGAHALESNINGYNNTALGAYALASNLTGYYNTALGPFALGENTSGNNNTALGPGAGSGVTTGSNNILIGNEGLNESGAIRIGTDGVQTATFIAGVHGTSIVLGGSEVLVSAAGQLGIPFSSRRFKEDIRDMGRASNPLLRLRPVTFRYKQAAEDGSKPLQYGLIAEEVEEVMPELVAHDKDGQPETVYYHLLPALLLNEFQRQEATLAAQAIELDKLRGEVTALRAAVEEQDRQQTALRQLRSELDALKSRLGAQSSQPAPRQ